MNAKETKIFITKQQVPKNFRNNQLTLDQWIVVIVVILVCLCLGIPAILIGIDKTASECLLPYDNISFNYVVWLYSFATMQFLSIFIILWFAIWPLICTIQIPKMPQMVIITLSLFTIAWYIIGSILFFKQVVPECNGQKMYHFASTVFILQTIGIFVISFNLIKCCLVKIVTK